MPTGDYPALRPFARHPAITSYSVTLATAGWLGLTAGLTALSLALIKPLAHGAVGSYSLLQLGFYALLLACTAAAAVKSLSPEATLLIMAAGSAAIPLAHVLLHRKGLLNWRAASFNSLAGQVLISGNLVSVFERLDLFYVGAMLPAEKAGLYGVAVRVAGGLAVASGGVSAFAIPRVTQAANRADFRRRYMQLVPAITIVTAMTLTLVVLAPWLVPVIFGERYSPAVPWLQVIAVQYPLAAFVAPIAHLLPFLGRPRWQWEHTAVLVVVAAFVLWISSGNLLVIACSRPLAQLGGAVYIVVRYFQFKEREATLGQSRTIGQE